MAWIYGEYVVYLLCNEIERYEKVIKRDSRVK